MVQLKSVGFDCGGIFGGGGWCRWGVRVWKSVRHWLWNQHVRTQCGAVQQWPQLRSMLRTEMRPHWFPVVPLRKTCHSHHCHQLLPSKLRGRLVQHSPPALRPILPHVHHPRPSSRRRHPRHLPKVPSALSTTSALPSSLHVHLFHSPNLYSSSPS